MKLINGDVRNPIGEGNKFICHCCNNVSKMGSGVALALLQKWPRVRSEYIDWAKKTPENFILGNVQLVWVEDNIGVINMIGQNGIKSETNTIPVKYDALEKCLQKVKFLANKYNASIHFPERVASDRAGGNWDIVQEMIGKELANLEVIIYKFEG